MTRQEEALALLEAMRTCVPRDLFACLDEMHRGAGSLLGYLDMADGVVYAGDIARELNVSTARIAAILNRMEKNGFIQREPSTADARKTVVKLTGRGRTWIRRTREQMLERAEQMLDRVGKEDMWEFIRLSRKISSAMGELGADVFAAEQGPAPQDAGPDGENEKTVRA